MEVRSGVLRSKNSPLRDSVRRREYFDVLYLGLCGAHIAAAVVARGGIVADSKDGWLRKVCWFDLCMCVLFFLAFVHFFLMLIFAPE